MNSELKPIYLGSYIQRTANLNSKIANSVNLNSTIDKDLSTVIYETIFINQNYRANIETNLNLSLATIKQFKIKKPDSTVIIKNASYSGSILYYDLTGTENDQAGLWTFQPLLSFPDRNPISTATILVEVKETI